MEDTLRAKLVKGIRIKASLNPCFNGRYSQRQQSKMTKTTKNNEVLILVLMEDTLREVFQR